MRDTIEDRIDIDATAEQVWHLVSEPGWWIGDGTYRTHVVEQRGEIAIVTDETHGTFPILTVRRDAPRHVAFRWLADAQDLVADGPGTLTEFWIDDRDGGVTLRVRESGFGSLGESEADLLRHIDDNTKGWREELGVAKRAAEAGART